MIEVYDDILLLEVLSQQIIKTVIVDVIKKVDHHVAAIQKVST